MILVDTSAWIEYLRSTGTATCERVESLLAGDSPLATTEVVAMEVLAGARDDMHHASLKRLLRRCDLLAIQGLQDYEQAAELYRRCRRNGETVRVLVDCLIAAVAIRHGIPVLHHDRDFDVLARHAGLALAS